MSTGEKIYSFSTFPVNICFAVVILVELLQHVGTNKVLKFRLRSLQVFILDFDNPKSQKFHIHRGSLYTPVLHKKSKEKEESRSVSSSKRFNVVHLICL